MERFKKIDVFLLSFFVVIALLLRLYKIDIPLADWHSWRQVDTAAVARNLSQGEFNLLYPRYDDLSNVQSGQYNPEGYRFVEFPAYNAMFAALHKYVPLLPIEIYGRLVSIFFSLLVLCVLYYIALREHSRVAAFGAALIYATFPFFVYYSRTVLPETTAVGFSFIALFLAYVWARAKHKAAILLLVFSWIFAAVSILIKPTVIFYFLPIAYVFFIKYRFRLIKKPAPYLYFITAVIPFIAWRMWIGNFPEGIPGFEWLITSVNTFEGQKVIFFRPAFFRWIFHERILLLIMGGFAVVLPLLGVLENTKKSLVPQLIFLAALGYLLVFQGGNVQHDYYQTIILPALALASGFGFARLLRNTSHDQAYVLNLLLVVFIIGFSWVMSYYKIKDYYLYSEDLVNIGKIINTLTPQDAKVITDRNGDTTLLYLANRKGMPAVPDTLENLKAKGMEYFYTDKKDVAEEVRKIYTPVFENSHVFIFKL